MPLLLLDLDNTLVDRDTAFCDAVAEFLAAYDLPRSELTWIRGLDEGGYAPRAQVAAAMNRRYGPAVPATAVQSLLDGGGDDRVTVAESTREALEKAHAAGWVSVIVTNGTTAQQESKIRITGLDRLVRAWVVSEAVGHKKPEPEIFHAAARAAGQPLTGAWMVGDSAHADIAGANALGLLSVWVSNGRIWTEESHRPTHVAAHVGAAVEHVVGTLSA
ncbi:HAD family hydrolase [Streptomyces longispororuber]|uniref:HAD family hydrolase n=1 Tax=Streptomyces longispororuber TaxID=68230 RepID=UPI00210E4BB9|nr:HAD family hydrolase [Streptomyces longispororuber]MCQ4208944.1 HAD family hydrolase [Streptomyces longispororuber]